jgi:Tfp pilus assembly protein PilP
MWRLLLTALLLCGCSKGPEADLQYIKQARSASAEWALVNTQVSQGKVTATYVSSMHEWLREAIKTSAAALTQPDSDYGREMHTLLQLPDDSPPDELQPHTKRLKQIEDSLESA